MVETMELPSHRSALESTQSKAHYRSGLLAPPMVEPREHAMQRDIALQRLAWQRLWELLLSEPGGQQANDGEEQ